MTPKAGVYFKIPRDTGEYRRAIFSQFRPKKAWVTPQFVRYKAMNSGELTVYGRTAMKSIVVTYPGYQALPRGIKRLLVESETSFFSEAAPDRSTNRTGRKASWQASTDRLTGGNDSLWGRLGQGK